MENSGYRGRGKGVRRAVYRDQQDGQGSVRQCMGGSAEKRTGLHMAEHSADFLHLSPHCTQTEHSEDFIPPHTAHSRHRLDLHSV